MNYFNFETENIKALAPTLDLITEATSILRGDANVEINGVSENVEQQGDIKIHTVEILNDLGAQRLQKMKGKYITIDIPEIQEQQETIATISGIVAEKLKTLLPNPLRRNMCVLVIGLGNERATPDALGPQVISRTIATRHLFRYAPQDVEDNLFSLAALAPGVLGITGIETFEIIKGVTNAIQPQAVIVIDALSAASICRVGTTIQMADCGISPGSGLGTNNAALNKQSLGVPVIAIGVPTMINTSIILYETINNLLEYWDKQYKSSHPKVDDKTIKYIGDKLFQSFRGNLMVTPREIDQLVSDVSEILAASIAQAVHPAANVDNYRDYIR